MTDVQDMNQQTILKTKLFGGFDKKQVLLSIDRLREENARAQQELAQRMQELADARRQLSEQVAGFEQTIGQLEGQLKESQGRVSELSSTVGTLENTIEGYKKDAADNTRALKVQMEQNRQLTMRAEAFEKKAVRYDEFSSQLGDILLEAKSGANDILSAARAQAEAAKGEYIRAAQKFADEASSLKNDIANLRGSMTQAVEEMERRLNEMEDMLDTFISVGKPAEAGCYSGEVREFF